MSGTGGNRVAAELLAMTGCTEIYVPSPTWANHHNIYASGNLQTKLYRYYDTDKSDLDWEGLLEDFEGIPEGTPVLLHACAHNPTGMDPTMEQWKELSQVCLKRHLLPVFDCAYQGFASGDADTDAAAVRQFVADGHSLLLIQSFSKNFGLYGQRVGCLSVVASNKNEAECVLSQMKAIARPMYSFTPRHGARIVAEILSDETLKQQWAGECKGMAQRIQDMRTALVHELTTVNNSPHDWSHITKQIGMFAFSGLTKEQVEQMIAKYHVYCTTNGRISMAGVTTGNVAYVAKAMHEVTK